MKTSTLITMSALVLASMGLLFVMNFTPLFKNLAAAKNYIELNDIQAISIEKEGKPHTLNLEQQIELVKYLNLTVPVEKKTYENQDDKVNFQQITIYRFNQPEIVIKPVATIGKDLLLSIPAWNPSGYMRDLSSGSLQNLIDKSIEK